MRKAPPGLIAAAEQDYHADRDRLTDLAAGAQLVLTGRDSEVEVYADVYAVLDCCNPGTARRIAAAAIVAIAKQHAAARGNDSDTPGRQVTSW